MNFPLTLTSALKNFSPFAGTVVPHELIKRGITWRLVNAINSSSAYLDVRLSRERKPPEIFHRTYYSTSGNYLKLPEVLTVYDMIHEDFPSFFKKPLLETKLSSIQKAKAVICISEYTRNRLLDLSDVDPAKVTVVPLGVRANNLSADKIRNTAGRPYMVYVGSRGGYKNFGVLEKAFSEMTRTNTELDLYLVGGGPLTKEERDRFDFLGIGTYIHHASSTTDVNQLVNLAQCVVSTSLAEGFGLVPLEALNQGTPCVVSDIEVNREIWGDTLPSFAPNDHLELALQIQRLLDSDDHWYSISQKGAAVAKGLSVERMAESTLKVYRSVTQ
jgi:glycosyltransferase involved in cell wall biosynthesis